MSCFPSDPIHTAIHIGLPLARHLMYGVCMQLALHVAAVVVVVEVAVEMRWS